MTSLPNPRLKKILIVLLFALFLFVADYLTKQAILRNFTLYEYKKITGYLNLVLVTNKGAAFNLLAGEGARQGLKLTIVSLLAMLPLAYFYRLAKPTDTFFLASLGIIVGGAAGNIHDRLAYNAVVDFLDFHYNDSHWPAFNVADIGICVGVAGVILICLIDMWKSRGARERGPEGPAPSGGGRAKAGKAKKKGLSK
jgi:signal peptidase II